MELMALSRVSASLGTDCEFPCCKQVWHNLWLAVVLVSDLKSSHIHPPLPPSASPLSFHLASYPPSLLSPLCIHSHDVICDARHLEVFARVCQTPGHNALGVLKLSSINLFPV